MSTPDYPGKGVRIEFTVRDVDGGLVTPGGITINHYNPAFAPTELTEVEDSEGTYHVDYTYVAADATAAGAMNRFIIQTTNPDGILVINRKVYTAIPGA